MLLLACVLVAPASAQFGTRTEAIEAERRDKQARLWPRENDRWRIVAYEAFEH
jgi:hypothetical protein